MAFIKTGKHDGEIQDQNVVSVTTRFGRIGLTRVEGQLYAFQDACTHDDGPLIGGELRGHCIECPRHGAQFDVRTGEVLQMPATEPIEVYPIRVAENGEVEVDLD